MQFVKFFLLGHLLPFRADVGVHFLPTGVSRELGGGFGGNMRMPGKDGLEGSRTERKLETPPPSCSLALSPICRYLLT